MIKLNKLNLSIDERNVLDNCTFNFGRQTYVVSGTMFKRKTLLLQSIANAYRSYTPSIRYSHESGVIYLPANKFLIEQFTVYQNITYFARMFKVNIKQAMEIANLFKLDNLLKRQILSLPDEQKQMVRLCCAFLNVNASVIILDDPLHALGQNEIDTVKSYLSKFQNKKTIIIGNQSKHNFDDFNPVELKFEKNILKVVN